MKTITNIIYAAFAVVFLALGTVTASGARGDLFASIDGTDSIYQYTPNGVQSTFASGLSGPRGVAFDSAGNLFVATNFCDTGCHPTILKITPDGTQSSFAGIAGDFFAEGLAIDRSDNVFAQTTAGIIYKFTPDGVQSIFGSVPTIPSRRLRQFQQRLTSMRLTHQVIPLGVQSWRVIWRNTVSLSATLLLEAR